MASLVSFVTGVDFYFDPGSITAVHVISSVMYALIIGFFFMAKRETLERQKFISVRNTISASIAHELRTPLRSIYLDNSLIHKEVLDLRKEVEKVSITGSRLLLKKMDLMDKCLYRITTQLKRSFLIIDRLLTIFRFYKMKRVSWGTHSLKETVESALDEYGLSDFERSIIDTRLNNDLFYKGDPLILKHVFLNLLRNSLYHVKKKGEGNISISVELFTDDKILIVFKDTGFGIKTSDLPYIFEDGFTKTPYGFGIGLNFCKTALQMMGGYISCDSVYGKYAEFKIGLKMEKGEERV